MTRRSTRAALPDAALRDEGVRSRQQRVQQRPAAARLHIHIRATGRLVATVRPSRPHHYGAGTDVVYYQRYATERSLNPEIRVRGDLFFGRRDSFCGSRIPAHPPAAEPRDRRAIASAGAIVEGRRRRPLFSKDRQPRSPADYKPVRLLPARPSTMSTSRRRSIARRPPAPSSRGTRHHAPHDLRVASRVRHRPLRVLSASECGSTVKVLPGVEFKPRALISGSAHVGFRRFTPLTARSSASQAWSQPPRSVTPCGLHTVHRHRRPRPDLLLRARAALFRRRCLRPHGAPPDRRLFRRYRRRPARRNTTIGICSCPARCRRTSTVST